jgi:hypothetical protein
MKKLKLLFLAITLFTFCFSSKVFADEINVQEIIHYGDSIERDVVVETKGLSEFVPFETPLIRGTSVPSSVWNLSTQGTYNMSGQSTNTTLYTDYLFKGTSTMNIWVTWAQWYNVEIKLMKKIAIFADQEVASFTHVTEYEYPNKQSQFIVTGLDSSSKYYLKIYAPVYFTGYVTQ